MLSDVAGVDTTVYASYDGGDPDNFSHQGSAATAWHRRMSPEVWLWLIVVGSIAGLWLIAGSFRRILS